MLDSASFKSLRDRDAWAAIRGFVYQVDLTILRWMQLDDSTFLELERGEDIDLVTRAIKLDDYAERERILNQVKYRQEKLTLRHPEALGAIACFIEHRATNPILNLQFRFSTNAEAACERPPIFEKYKPGIHVWMSLHRDEISPNMAANLRLKLKEFIIRQNRPHKLNAKTWRLFTNFFKDATDEALSSLISKFEWETGLYPEKDMTDYVVSQVLQKKLAVSLEHAHEIYMRLFLHVFKLLSSSGRKILSKRQLAKQCQLRTLSSDMQATLDKIKDIQTNLNKKMEAVERQLGVHSLAIARLQEESIGHHQIETDLDFVGIMPIIEIPPLARKGSDRRKNVERFLALSQQHPWLAIHGPTGTGKTQLAILLARKMGIDSVWIRMRSEPDKAPYNLALIKRALEVATSCQICTGQQDWINTLFKRLGTSKLIVLDDMPQFIRDEMLFEIAFNLCQACQEYRLHMITTSAFPPPSSIIERLSSDAVYSEAVPPLDNTELEEILLAHGAPSNIIKSRTLLFISAICGHNPSLAVAAAQYLENRHWHFSKHEFDDLLGGKYQVDINRETSRRISATIARSESRDLLERLSIILYTFSNEDIKAVATVTPPINRPLDQFQSLIGLWVQYDDRDNYLVSPLARSLGPLNLSEETKQQVNHILGENVLKRIKLNQEDVMQAIIYFTYAKAWNEAASVLLTALHAMIKQGVPAYDAGLLSIWSDLPLPSGINLSLRIFIRGSQINLNAKSRKSVDYLISDLDSLVAVASEKEDFAILMSSISTILAVSGMNPESACRSLGRAYGFLPVLEKKKDMKEAIENFPLGSLLWIAARDISTSTLIVQWLEIALSMPIWLLDKVRQDDLAEIGSFAITNKIWLLEADKPQDSRGWSHIHDILSRICSAALQLNLPLLWACAIRSQIIIFSEYEALFEDAISLGRHSLEENEDPACRFLIKDCIADQFLFHRDNSGANAWYREALLEKTETFPLIRIRTYLHASLTISDEELHEALGFLEQAMTFGTGRDDVPRTELAKIAGEICIIHGNDGNLPASFSALDSACSHLLAERQDSAKWKGLFMALGHVSGYYSGIACSGNPPGLCAGGEPYSRPHRGLFLSYKEKECAELYEESRASYILVQLALFADSVGAFERAEYWALSGMESARKSRSYAGVAELSYQVVPALILRNRFAESLSIALESAYITSAANKARQAGMSAIAPEFDYESVLGPKPSDAWNQAEIFSIPFGLMPAICRLITEYGDSQETAIPLAQELFSACEQISLEASHKALWQRSADLINMSFLRPVSSRSLTEFSNTLDSQEFGWLRLIGYLGATAQPDCPLTNACKMHLNSMSLAAKFIKPFSRMTYDKILVPWIASFWAKAFRQNRFRFSSPLLVEQELTDALDGKLPNREHKIMQTIMKGLNMIPDEQAKEWLRDLVAEPGPARP